MLFPTQAVIAVSMPSGKDLVHFAGIKVGDDDSRLLRGQLP